jgi:hypothetical protein
LAASKFFFDMGMAAPLNIAGALADHLDRLSTRNSVENKRFEIGLWGNDAALVLSELGSTSTTYVASLQESVVRPIAFEIADMDCAQSRLAEARTTHRN